MPQYTKEKLMQANEFVADVDVLALVVLEGELLTKEEARERIAKFKNREVSV